MNDKNKKTTTVLAKNPKGTTEAKVAAQKVKSDADIQKRITSIKNSKNKNVK